MENKDEKELKYEYYLLSERHVFYIAVLLITIVGVLLVLYFPSDEQIAQGLLTAILAWISAIVGFYFGSKPVSDVVSRLQGTEKEYAHRTELLDKTIDEYNNIIKLSKDLEELIKE